MLLRVALHQTRFRAPGVSPDPRGVLLGPKGLVLFPSLDRAVGFLRAVSDDGLLDELVAGLELRYLETPLKTRELMLSVTADSSYRMDRVAAFARLTGGLTFTGASRHFVRYRDAAAPLGYDVDAVVDAPADLVVYDERYHQTYRHGRPVPLLDLIRRLCPVRTPEAHADADSAAGKLWVAAELGVGHALVSYLFRWRVSARAAVVEWPSESAFDDQVRRLHLLELTDPSPRVVRLLRSLPGVWVYRPTGSAAAVELGHRHPVALDGCASLFPADSLHLFRGDGEVSVVSPLPPFAPVSALVRTPLSPREPPPVRGDGTGQAPRELSLRLRLLPSNEPYRSVVATVIPRDQRPFLARLLYALPRHVLEGLRLAVTEDHVFALDRRGIEGVPLGRFCSEVAPRVYVPAGLSLVPAIAPEVLATLVHGRDDAHVFFLADEDAPLAIPTSAFGPVETRVLSEISARPIHADLPNVHDPELPLFEYDAPRRFPLRGIPTDAPPALRGVASDGSPEPEPEAEG